MNDTKRMKVSYTLNHLKDDLLHSFLRQLEFPFCDVVEQVLAWQVLKNYKVIFVVLEQVDQLDYVLVLAHLQNLNFAPLLVNFNRLHVGLSYDFDCNLIAIAFVSRKFYNAKLTLPQVFLNVVKVVHVGKPDCVSDCVCPFFLQ